MKVYLFRAAHQPAVGSNSKRSTPVWCVGLAGIPVCLGIQSALVAITNCSPVVSPVARPIPVT